MKIVTMQHRNNQSFKASNEEKRMPQNPYFKVKKRINYRHEWKRVRMSVIEQNIHFYVLGIALASLGVISGRNKKMQKTLGISGGLVLLGTILKTQIEKHLQLKKRIQELKKENE